MLFSFLKHIPSVAREVKIFEYKRKVFHLLGIVIPFITLMINKKLILQIFVVITLLFIIIDYNKWFLRIKIFKMHSIFFKLLRQKEAKRGELCGLSWLFIGYIIILSSCDIYLVAMAITILIICDAMASIIGQNFGKISLCGKSLEGFVAYILSGIAVLFFYYKFFPNQNFNITYLIISLIISALSELIAKKIHIDDNFAIPVSFCFTYKILLMLFT